MKLLNEQQNQDSSEDEDQSSEDEDESSEDDSEEEEKSNKVNFLNVLQEISCTDITKLQCMGKKGKAEKVHKFWYGRRVYGGKGNVYK